MIKTEALKALEFDKVLGAISSFSNSEASKKAALDISPLKCREDIQKRFGQIQEIRTLFQKGTPLNLSHFEDISSSIEKIRPDGSALDAGELALFMPALQIISDVSTQIKAQDKLSFLNELVSGFTGFPELLAGIRRSVDSEGNILDSASRELSHLRARIRSLEANIQKQLETLTRDKKITPFLMDDFITKRAGRWVIPVRMDSKGRVRGVAHDVSHSGETVFIEPLETIGITNELENLIADEKAEEIKILREISEIIRNNADSIMTQFRTLVYLDMLNSISGFAEFLNMETPQINESHIIRLAGARHPLLMLIYKQGGMEKIVPVDISLGKNVRAMVITGPNAGGKTITIKTLGLLTLMALSGIPIPADSSSSLPLVNKILIDIGDEQSIENSLSTFSAHISNLSRILKEADAGTIALIDELGTGTEPLQGSAIGCAVLNDLKEKGSLALATTHLTEIVGFVYRTDGMLNASMDFDRKTLTPLYRLTAGEPGESHALETAQKYGLPDKTVAFAKLLIGTSHDGLRDMISDLKEKRLAYENATVEAQTQKTDLEKKNLLLEEKIDETEKQRSEVIKRAYEEAKEIIEETKRKMNLLMDEMKKERSRVALKKLDKTYQEINKKLREFKKELFLSIDEIKEGDTVFAGSLGYDVRIIGIDRKQNRLRVRAGNMYIEVPASDISSRKGMPALQVSGDKDHPESDEIKSSLNIIGMRVDDAMSMLEPFLNHAALEGLNQVIIIHGEGTGALLRAVRSHLNSHPLVKEFRQGKQHEGGNGITIATMK